MVLKLIARKEKIITIVEAGGRRTPLVLVVSLYLLSFAFTRIESKSKLNRQSITLLQNSNVLTQRNNLIQRLKKKLKLFPF